MKIDLKELKKNGAAAAVRGEEPAEALRWDYGPRDVVRPSGPLRYGLSARLALDELLVEGEAEAEFSGTCCRCGGPLRRVYSAEVRIERQVAPDAAEADLTSELREAILLALPNHPVCSDDCPGFAQAAPPPPPETVPDGTSGPGPWGALDGLFGGPTHDNTRPRSKKRTPNENKR